MSKVKCELCNGTGMQDCPMEYGDSCPEECPACGGEQKVVCTDCDGSGKVEDE